MVESRQRLKKLISNGMCTLCVADALETPSLHIKALDGLANGLMKILEVSKCIGPQTRNEQLIYDQSHIVLRLSAACLFPIRNSSGRLFQARLLPARSSLARTLSAEHLSRGVALKLTGMLTCLSAKLSAL